MKDVKAHGGEDRRGLREVRLAHGDQVGPLRQVPRLLGLPGVQEHPPAAGRRRRRRAEVARGRAPRPCCPSDGQPMVLQEGPLRPLPGLPGYPECKVDAAPGARRGRQAARSRCSHPIDEKCPRVRQRPRAGGAAASAPSSPAATTRPASTSRRRKPRRSACSARSAARARWSSARAAGGASFYGCRRYPECQLHRLPPADRRALPGLRPRLPPREGDARRRAR